MDAKASAAALMVAAAVVTGTATTAHTAGRQAHFAGFPPVGVKASTPTSGRLLLALSPTATTKWNVYADGRIVWQKWTPAGDATVVPAGAKRFDTGYVQQRLTFSGVQLLLSRVLATGLFEHDLRLAVKKRDAWFFHQLRRGDELVTVAAMPWPDPWGGEHFTEATPAQSRALGWIAALVAHPARRLPTKVWADRQVRAFVPACYVVAFDRAYPDVSKLPSPVREVLPRYKPLRRDGDQVLTTRQARTLLQALAEAGIAPDDNHASNIGFSLGRLPGQPRPSYLHLSPLAPPERSC